LNKLDFVVIGAQKSATTWLFECLHEHPEVVVPQQKEVHFFCRENDCRFSTRSFGKDWYLSNFNNSSDSKIKVAGELTTDYMYYPYVVDDLHRFQPDLKIIALLRNPVDRAYSAYWMWRRHNQNLPDFQDMLAVSDSSLLARGLYMRQLLPYLSKFGREKVKIYIYEEIQRQPEEFFTDLYGWLGVDQQFRPRAMKETIGGTRVYPGIMGKVVYKGLSPIINLRYIRPLWRALARYTSVKKWILDRISTGGGTGYPPLDPVVRNRLVQFFSEENDALFREIGREIPDWKQ